MSKSTSKKAEWSRFLFKGPLSVAEINKWINQNIQYVSDVILHGKEDYWASPEETLERGAGDCEDIAILKFFTLKKAGCDMKNVRLAYVLYCPVDGEPWTPHVVVFFKKVVLDNFMDEVYLRREREDLIPVFTFDENGVYVHDLFVSNTSKLPVWKALLNDIAV